MNKIFFGIVNNQKIQLQNQEEFNSLIASLDNKEVELTLCKRKKKRTLDQNDYMWRINRLLANELGWEAEDMHSYLKERFAPKKKINIKGTETIMPKGTSLFSKEEFSEYIERIKRFAAQELSIVIPDTNEIK